MPHIKFGKGTKYQNISEYITSKMSSLISGVKQESSLATKAASEAIGDLKRGRMSRLERNELITKNK